MFRAVYLIVFGLILHDLPEGFAMANSYIISPGLGTMVAIAIALHNIPEEFAMALPLIITRKRKTLVKFATLSALAEPVGALVGIFSIALVPSLIPYFLAFAAGAMIFISLHELLPMACREKQMPFCFLGIFLSIVLF